MQSLKSWLWIAAVGTALALCVVWSERVPAVRPVSAPTDSFSAARAWPTLTMLADTIGLRVTGTPGADAALAYLVAIVRGIPGVEVQVQDVTGARSENANFLVSFRTKNLLVRIPGESAEAVLVSSHYDSPTSSVGASDAGVAVAAMVEMIRNLAASPRLARTVIFNINGAEEQGLLGAEGFLRHPWMRDVRVFIDLESAGTANKALLFQTGPGHSWLAKRYAASAPHPYGTVLGQDIFQSGAIPSSTDFEIYRDGAQVPGVDVAFYQNGYAYHTQLDRTWNVAPGSLQHMGANALAFTRALASGDIPRESARRAVYYDVLGVFMLAYDDTTAIGLAILAIILAVAATVFAKRRLQLAVGQMGLGFGISLAAWLMGFGLATLLSLVPSVLLGKPHAWFAHPALPFVGYASLAVTPLFALHGWLARRRAFTPVTSVASFWSGALAFMTLVLALLTACRAGSGYLLLWWVAPAAIGLAIYAALPQRRRSLAFLTLIPGALLTMQAAVLLLEFRSIGGRMPLVVPFDVPMAAIVSLIALLLCTIPITALHSDPWPRYAAVAMGVTGLVALAVGTFRFPYSPLRPQRLAISHRESADSATVRVAGFDYVGPREALKHFPEARVVPSGSSRRGPYSLPATSANLAPVTANMIAATFDSARNERTLTLHLSPTDAYAQQLSVAATRFVRWIPADSMRSPGSARRAAEAVAHFVSTPNTGWTIGLVVTGREPVTINTVAIRTLTTPPVAALIAKLPEWTSSYATAQARRTITF